MTPKTIVKKLNKIKRDLEKSRDELRDMESGICELLNDKDSEIQQLEYLIDSLSQYV